MIFEKNHRLDEKNPLKTCTVQKKAVILHRDSERGHNEGGSLAQLNRASDYGSEGYRFESCANHNKCGFLG